MDMDFLNSFSFFMLKCLVDFQWIEYCNLCWKRLTKVLWFCIDMTYEGEYMMRRS